MDETREVKRNWHELFGRKMIVWRYNSFHPHIKEAVQLHVKSEVSMVISAIPQNWKEYVQTGSKKTSKRLHNYSFGGGQRKYNSRIVTYVVESPSQYFLIILTL